LQIESMICRTCGGFFCVARNGHAKLCCQRPWLLCAWRFTTSD
jgi:hypothetical protein